MASTNESTTAQRKKGQRKSGPTRFPGQQRHPRSNKTKDQDYEDVLAIVPKPLSVIAQERPDISVVNPVGFAGRSMEERHRAAKQVGRVKRPLNAFMLYRKTYQEVARALSTSASSTKASGARKGSTKANHQQISRICGASWKKLEPQDLRKKFEELAKVETKKHLEAHPGYKYVPVANKKGKPEDSPEPADDGEVSDGDGHVYTPRRSTQGIGSADASVASGPSKTEPGHLGDFPGSSSQYAMLEQGYWDGAGTWRSWTPSQYPSHHIAGNHQYLHPQYLHPPCAHSNTDPGRFQEPVFAGVPSVTTENTDRPLVVPSVNPMTSIYDPLLSVSAGPLSPSGSSNVPIYPPLVSQNGWQPQAGFTSEGHWNPWGNHDTYLSNQDEWQVDELEPGQFDQFFQQVGEGDD